VNNLSTTIAKSASTNCTVSTSALGLTLSLLTRAISTRSTLPVLGNILIDTSDTRRLELTATNLDLTIKVTLDAQVAYRGKITVPGKLFAEYIGSLPDGLCSLAIDEEKMQLLISYGENRTSIHGMAASEFPPVATPVGGSLVEVDAVDLEEAIVKTIVAASGDDAAAMLTGVAVQVSDGKLVLAATDRHRLAVTTLPATGDGGFGVNGAIVPARHMAEIARAVQKEPGKIRLSMAQNGNQIFVECGNTHIASRLIEGNYPNFRQVIPSVAEQTLKINRLELLSAVKTAAVMARETAHPVSMTLSESTLTLRSKTAEIGEHEVSMHAEIEGSDLEMAFNARYLMDALGCITSDTVDISFSGPKNPGVLRPGDGSDYIHVIMPVKIPTSN